VFRRGKLIISISAYLDTYLYIHTCRTTVSKEDRLRVNPINMKIKLYRDVCSAVHIIYESIYLSI